MALSGRWTDLACLGRRHMQVRSRSGKSRRRFYIGRRHILLIGRWTFLAIGAVTVASVLFQHLYHVNESIYDPALFAIGVGGLFTIACGVILMVASRNERQRVALRTAAARCEELADHIWELKESEERATSLLEAQGDLIVRRDSEGRVSYANDAFCSLAGKARDALIGSKAALMVLEQGKTDVLPDGTRVHDQKIATCDGARWLAWRDVVVRGKDGGAEVQSVGRDVTDRTKAEHALAEARDAAEAASRAKSRFLAMVSHEVRTPLNGILGMADLLLDTTLTPEQTTYVKAARDSGEALLSLIEEILDFSKIEADKLALETCPFALATLVEEVVELLGPRAQAKGLEIASDIADRLPELVIGDAARLRQVLLNLAGNAIKFTETGGVSVVVEPGAKDDEVVFEVRDTGIGIAPDQQQRVFLEFEQADGGAARKFGGTGLGLAISKRIVERMSGRIDMASAPGAGSTFRITLILTRATETPTSSAAPPHLNGFAVLIVAPESIEASMLARRLTRWGATIAIADKSNAEAELSRQRWDAVLINPALGAQAVTQLLCSIGNAIPRRIVLLTPSERHGLAALKDSGCTGYLVKPVRAASLVARLAGVEGFDTQVVPDADRTASGGPAAPGAVLSVLVAEDNDINALLVRALLAKLGHYPTVAASGSAALDAWRTARDKGTPYDLVLMDVHMPGLDGLEAARRIRAAEADSGGHTSIIALTANAFSEDRDACLAAGMDGFLVKPLDRERLGAAIAELKGRTRLAA